jgi:hypothetical protein
VDTALEILKQILGADVSDDRLRENIDAYRTILVEIERLRSLDLTEVHPAVVFDPRIPYRSDPERRP